MSATRRSLDVDVNVYRQMTHKNEAKTNYYLSTVITEALQRVLDQGERFVVEVTETRSTMTESTPS